MILKFESAPDDVYFVEATGNMGVSLNKWQYLKPHIGHDKFYEKLVIRHVDFNRGEKMVKNLEKFLGEVVGLKYGIGSSKLMRQKTVIKSELD